MAGLPRHARALVVLGLAGAASPAPAAASVATPTDLIQPGTQPLEARLDPAPGCRSCHGGYEPKVAPSTTWSGSMMAHAARDPLLWAALEVAEQDFVQNETAWAALMPATTPERGGAGEFCLRCHTPSAWLEGRSSPSNGSALVAKDYQSVTCDLCHRAVDPISSEALTLVRSDRRPWWTNPRTNQVEGFYGSGQFVVENAFTRRGPYDNSVASHDSAASIFQRQGELCGTCHDVSNPVTASLAPNSGRQDATALGRGAALTNPPYAYGVIERTFSEWVASSLGATETTAFPTLPGELRAIGGAIEWASRFPAYSSSGDPVFNPKRTYSCATCHLRPTTGQGCNLNPPVRPDLPVHDLTGGNTWVPAAMLWLSAQGKLRGDAFTPEEESALGDGKERARAMLGRAASLEAALSTDRASLVVKVTNLTGHKLPSGYPEGRRAWLNLRFYDATDRLIRELGRYDAATADLTLDTRVYEARLGMTPDWAARLTSYGYDPATPLTFHPDDTVEWTLGDLAAGLPPGALATFHFVLNNAIVEDSRIPPYGFSEAIATERQALPVPAGAYPILPGGAYRHWDEYTVPLPPGAVRAEATLFYQTAAKDYIRFLRRAGPPGGAGDDLHQAWAATGMSPPEPMARTAWRADSCAAPPAPVGDLRMAKSAGRVGLWWSPPAGATAARLFRHAARDRGDPPAFLWTDAPQAVDDVLGEPRDWYYDLRGENSCGQSPR